MFESAAQCAQYIMDCDSEHDDYWDWTVNQGEDPREHILYHAAVVLGCDDEFADDIKEYLRIVTL